MFFKGLEKVKKFGKGCFWGWDEVKRRVVK